MKAKSYVLDPHMPGSAAVPACPRCGGLTALMRRRPIDALVNLVLPQRRYRCRMMGCAWEGNLRESAAAALSRRR